MGANSALLSLQDSVLDQIEKLSCGHPGAVLVLFKLFSSDRDPCSLLLDMDDLELAGSGIWTAYKDICREDVDDFIRRIRNRIIYN
jgi:hypothetical protein